MKSSADFEKLMWFRCLICNWFGTKHEAASCEHKHFQRRLYGIRRRDE